MNFIDPDLLRTFLAFAEGGSLAHAAAAVNRSPSAVTAQMQRLEALIGEPLLAPAGRGRTLTPIGEELVDHARRILDAHRDAWLSLRGARADGRISLGSTQDFADTTLPDLLRRFARTHPRVRLDLRIGRSKELTTAFDQGQVDILLTMRQAPAADEVLMLKEEMIWLCADKGLATIDAEVPLAVLDPPCGFRAAAILALEAAGRPFRIAATSPSLSGLRAAVMSGIAVTTRTARFRGPGIERAPTHLDLPPLPAAEFSLRLRAHADKAVTDLAALLADDLPSSAIRTQA
ncbi:LysR substrate-binding domain-containing protein [Sinorhizobium terangae]|uniref:LysR family transcriptional regulator n=1 Tax=Sinorhizobium terangae TaxID=110322 RepID=A0A6N7LEB5_SINTE|nr:LysR substrate-binding domain-containing protein [Sinorhizobium terangae]MBB4188144.1 DNA-binding transcriptional LysR family regulator [Sinorhizobium terangae]MQX16193.1 LysR family transcriptional regulator [Sinorhizobium terangae]WFU49411.1 LysR substrate-binding domain-containing protein [Sinorhizobium terangae]